MENSTTFAYMVFACDWNPGLANELGGWYWGDFVEASLSTEDQAEEPDEIWAYELDFGLKRIAPVQLTLGWDPRPTLLQTFASTGIEPIFRDPLRGEKHWFAFPIPAQPLQWPAPEGLEIANPQDFQRFQAVIDETVKLAEKSTSHLLFVAGEGFDYHVNAAHLRHNEALLRKTSLKFFDRHQRL